MQAKVEKRETELRKEATIAAAVTKSEAMKEIKDAVK